MTPQLCLLKTDSYTSTPHSALSHYILTVSYSNSQFEAFILIINEVMTIISIMLDALSIQFICLMGLQIHFNDTLLIIQALCR
jgi:hypothetical protein